MIELMIAAALAQAPPDPCNAAGQPVTPRPGCPAWRYVGQQDVGSQYVDPASLRRSGDTFEIMGRLVLISAVEEGTSSATARARYDCTGRSVTVLATRAYDWRGVLKSEETPSVDYVADESGGRYNFDAIMLREFCPRQAPARGAN